VAYVKIDTSVSRNRKFVKAGPAPSWLWLCGLLFCQDSLTDGFIPAESLPYLGVKNAGQLADHLVKAGLWHVSDGGWTVNDYLEHNRSANEVADLRAKRGNGGKLGGRPKKNLTETLKVSGTKTSTVPVSVVAADVVVDKKEELPAMDVLARELVNLYPAQGRCAWHMVERPLFTALMADPDVPADTAWLLLIGRLELQKRSHQWRVKGMIPRLDKWLREGLHLQELPESAPAAERLSKTTATTAGAVAEIMGEKAS
jgi:hypothetical protein